MVSLGLSNPLYTKLSWAHQISNMSFFPWILGYAVDDRTSLHGSHDFLFFRLSFFTISNYTLQETDSVRFTIVETEDWGEIVTIKPAFCWILFNGYYNTVWIALQLTRHTHNWIFLPHRYFPMNRRLFVNSWSSVEVIRRSRRTPRANNSELWTRPATKKTLVLVFRLRRHVCTVFSKLLGQTLFIDYHDTFMFLIPGSCLLSFA